MREALQRMRTYSQLRRQLQQLTFSRVKRGHDTAAHDSGEVIRRAGDEAVFKLGGHRVCESGRVPPRACEAAPGGGTR